MTVEGAGSMCQTGSCAPYLFRDGTGITEWGRVRGARSGSKRMRSRVPVALAKRSRVRVEGLDPPAVEAGDGRLGRAHRLGDLRLGHPGPTAGLDQGGGELLTHWPSGA